MDRIIIFAGESHGESERTGQPYHVYKFYELVMNVKTNVLEAKPVDLFAKRRLSGTQSIDFGSIVNLIFEDSSEIGGRPNLVEIDVVGDCPYLKLGVK